MKKIVGSASALGLKIYAAESKIHPLVNIAVSDSHQYKLALDPSVENDFVNAVNPFDFNVLNATLSKVVYKYTLASPLINNSLDDKATVKGMLNDVLAIVSLT